MIEQRAHRKAVVALVALAAALGGCGGGESEEPASREPAKIRVDGGKVDSDRLQELAAKRKADVARQRGHAAEKKGP